MGKFLIDLHCHTQEHSYDGQVPAREIVARLMELGFKGVVFTDHNEVWSDEEIAELRHEAGVGTDFIILSGQEVRTIHEGVLWGDLLVYGPMVNLPDGTSPLEIMKLVRETGGFAIAAHVGVPQIGLGEKANDIPVAAIETWNGRYGKQMEKRALEIAKDQSVPRIGGSDTHRIKDIGLGGTTFQQMPRSLSEIGAMIRDDACRPWKPSSLRFLKIHIKNKMLESRDIEKESLGRL